MADNRATWSLWKTENSISHFENVAAAIPLDLDNGKFTCANT